MAEVTLTFIGDMMCQMQQIRAIKRAGCGYNVAFEGIRPMLSGSDYVVANLETPVAGKKLRYAFEETRFNAPDDFLRAVKELGVDFVSMANNHCLDRGPEGVDATLRKVKELCVDSTGAYATREDADAIFVKPIRGIKFAFISCTYETNQGRKSDLLSPDEMWKVDQLAPPKPFKTTRSFAIRRFVKNLVPYDLKCVIKKVCGGSAVVAGEDYLPDSATPGAIDCQEHLPFITRIKEKIRRAKECADIVVVLPHLGGQYNPEPGQFQKWTVKWMSDAGADIVICNHAHTTLQSETLSDGTFVAYALGNFSLTPGVGYYRRGCQADFSVVLNLTFDLESKKLAGRSFFVTENVLRDDGVSIVRIADQNDGETRSVVSRFSGSDRMPSANGFYNF